MTFLTQPVSANLYSWEEKSLLLTVTNNNNISDSRGNRIDQTAPHFTFSWVKMKFYLTTFIFLSAFLVSWGQLEIFLINTSQHEGFVSEWEAWKSVLRWGEVQYHRDRSRGRHCSSHQLSATPPSHHLRPHHPHSGCGLASPHLHF